MKSIFKYHFHKTKYKEELLIDIVTLDNIRKYIDKHPTHILSYFDITFITNGTGLFSIGNEQYSLYQGDVIFSKPGEIRVWDKTKIPQGYALIFEEEFLLSFFNDHTFIQNLSYFNRKRTSAKINISNLYTQINNLLLTIIEEINNESKEKHLLRALLYEMLMLLNREYLKNYKLTSESKLQNRYINKFIILVDRHFKTYHSAKYYAEELCITPNYLNEIVQKHLGTNTKNYIQNKIIQEAKSLLSYTDLSTSEIADQLNFESSSYFIRLFRTYTNFTPIQYRHSINP